MNKYIKWKKDASLNEFASYLGVHPKAILLAIDEGHLTAYSKQGENYQIDVNKATDEFLKFLYSEQLQFRKRLDEDEKEIRKMKIPFKCPPPNPFDPSIFENIPKYLYECLPVGKQRNAQKQIYQAQLRVYRTAIAHQEALLKLLSVKWMIFAYRRLCSFNLDFNFENNKN